jgi:uncharacterized cupredoxin-like copper-binding protein
MFKRRMGIPLVAAAAAAAVVAGCGSSNNSGSSASSGTTTHASATPQAASSATKGSEVVKLMADSGGQLRFDKTKLSVKKPGKVTLQMINPTSAGMDHGISIEGNGVDKDGPTVPAGQTATITVSLKKGTYTYYCPVPGHEQAGMKGTLTVG